MGPADAIYANVHTGVPDGDDGTLDDYSAFDDIVEDDASAFSSQWCADAPARGISGQSGD